MLFRQVGHHGQVESVALDAVQATVVGQQVRIGQPEEIPGADVGVCEQRRNREGRIGAFQRFPADDAAARLQPFDHGGCIK